MDNPISAYDLVGSSNSAELVDLITNKMKEGWQPLGSPFIILDEVVQPIVKYKEPIDSPKGFFLDYPA